MPTREQVERAVDEVEELRKQHHGQHRHRCGGAGLSRALPEALRRRLGPALAQRHAVGPGAALPCRRDRFPGSNSGTCASIRSPTSGPTSPAFNAFRGTDWMPEPCRELRAARDRFRRLPLPGLRADRRRARDRSGVPPVAASRAGDRVGRGSRRPRIRLPALNPLGTHSTRFINRTASRGAAAFWSLSK